MTTNLIKPLWCIFLIFIFISGFVYKNTPAKTEKIKEIKVVKYIYVGFSQYDKNYSDLEQGIVEDSCKITYDYQYAYSIAVREGRGKMAYKIETSDNYSGWIVVDVYFGLDKDSLKRAMDLVTN